MHNDKLALTCHPANSPAILRSQEGEQEMPFFGPPNVDKLKKSRNIKGLVRALRYKKDDGIRSDAARALAEIGDLQAVEPLIAALKDEHSTVRKEAAETLDRLKWQPDESEAGKAYWKAKIESLVADLNSKHEVVRQRAARELAAHHRSGGLTEESKQQLLSLRSKIIAAGHRDEPPRHRDEHQDRQHQDEKACAGLAPHLDEPPTSKHSDGIRMHQDVGVEL